MLILTSDSPSKHAKYRMLKVSPQLFMIKLKLAYTQQPKVFQPPEFTRMPYKASIILVKSHNYIIQCIKISSNVIRVVYNVISGHVRSKNRKWHMCLHHVLLVAQREICLYLS